MADKKRVILPITGMTCANCVAAVERNLKKLDGVSQAVVNLSSERATVEFDTARLTVPDVIARVERAGYGVATGEADLVIKRLADDNDAHRLEKALAGLEGVLAAQVTFAGEKARIRYVPTMISQAEIRKAVAEAGFAALELGGSAEDAEAEARREELSEQRRLLVAGMIFTLPLFLFSMARDFGLTGPWAHAFWVHYGCGLQRRRCSSTWAGSITEARTSRLQAARPTWMCSLPWVHRRLTSIRFLLRWGLFPGTSILRHQRL